MCINCTCHGLAEGEKEVEDNNRFYTKEEIKTIMDFYKKYVIKKEEEEEGEKDD